MKSIRSIRIFGFTALILLLLAGCAAGGGDTVAQEAPAAAGSDWGGDGEFVVGLENADWHFAEPVQNETGDSAYRMGEVPPIESSASFDEPVAAIPLDTAVTAPGRTVITTGHLEVETETFDDKLSLSRAILARAGGFVENGALHVPEDGGPRVYMARFRIPARDYEFTVAVLKGVGHVQQYNVTVEDVTIHFMDLQSRLDTLLIREERMLTYIDRTANLNEVMRLERELSDLRAQIGRYRLRMQEIQGLASYSTLHFTLAERLPEDEAYAIAAGASFGQRMGDSLAGSVRQMENVAVFFAAMAVPLAILLVPAAVGVLFWKKAKRRGLEAIENE